MLRKLALLTGSQVAATALTTLNGMVLARVLGPTGRGELAIALLWPNLLAITIMGFDVQLGRVAGAGQQPIGALRRQALLIAMVAGSAVGLVGAVALPWLLPNDKQHLTALARFLLWQIPPQVFIVYLASIGLGAGQLRVFAVPRVLMPLVYTGGSVIAWSVGQSTPAAMGVAFSASMVLPAVAAGSLLGSGKANDRKPTQTTRPLSKLIVSSAPFVGNTTITALTLQLPAMLMTAYLAPAELGLYVVAFSAAGVQGVFGLAFSKVLFSEAASGQADGDGWLGRRMRFCLLSYSVMAVALGLTIPLLVPVLFGQEFSESSRLTRYLIPALSMVSIGDVLDEAMRGWGKAKPGIAGQVLGSATMVAIAALTLRSWGAMGMVAAVGGAAAMRLATLTCFAVADGRATTAELWLVRRSDVVAMYRAAQRVVERLLAYRPAA